MAFNKVKALQEAEKLVGEGNVAQAIRHYLQIIEREPTDYILLNTVGDLYLREKNVAEAMRHFNKLADTYTREGFTVKAIAIYKKIQKLDPGRVEPLVKLAELYAMQGLSREAREQYAQAVAFYRKKNQTEKALEVYRKIIQLDPENTAQRARLAEFCEQLGRKADAAQVYLEAAEHALRGGNSKDAELALKKAASLDPKSSKVRLLKVRLTLAMQRPEEAEKIIHSDPTLKGQPGARELLLEAYLASHKVREAEKLAVEVFRAAPGDFSPLASFAALCIEKGEFEAALKPLSEVADQLIEQKNAAPLVEVLRQVWDKSPNPLPALELLHRVGERTGDEFNLPEVLEALGNAYVQSGELEKAENAFRKLTLREPENDRYKDLLKQVLQKSGKELAPPTPAELSSEELALAPEPDAGPETAPPAPLEDAEQAAVKEALENSDLFSRYGLVDRAVAELAKALEVYPDQVEIHERILEICQRNQATRAAQAAEALARIYAQRGDTENAERYEAMARRSGGKPAAAAQTPKSKTAEFDLSSVLPHGVEPAQAPAVEEVVSAPPPEEAPVDLAGAPVAENEATFESETREIDLSGDVAALTGPPEAASAEPEVSALNEEEARIEINFYLEQGFEDEARKAIEAYEEKFPGDPRVAELRRHMNDYVGSAQASANYSGASSTLDVGPAAGPSTPAARVPEPPPVRARPRQKAKAPAAEPDLLKSLASDLASSLEGIQEKAPPAPVEVAPKKVKAKTAGSADAGASLNGLLEELGEPTEAEDAEEDPEKRYNLGVAFREMGLLDEAIGEFQKVVKLKHKGKFPPHFLQACTLLASSFIDKKMPAIAAKWYLRALEMPGLDEEATLALYYDLGVAYEQAGEPRIALEKFTEVYSQNIDYRDVAEKIRLLQQKMS